MSEFVHTKAGIEHKLRLLVSQRMTIRLFVNDREPGDSDRLNYYHEPEGGVYQRVVLNESDWKIKGDEAEAEIMFFADEKAYGWFQTDSTGKVLIGAERFGKAPVECFNGVKVKVVMKLKEKQ